jgi:hypothetical protein
MGLPFDPHSFHVRLDCWGPPGTVKSLFRNVRFALLIRASCPFTRSCSLGWIKLGTARQEPKAGMTESNDRVPSARASYAEGPEFDLRPESVYLDLRIFLVLLSLTRQILGLCLKSGSDRFLPYPFLFSLPFEAIQCSLSYWGHC